MKLKLDTQGAVSVLAVSGPVVAQELAVLRAGIAKLQGEGKGHLILDLTAAQLEPGIKMKLLELHSLSDSGKSLLAIASSDPEIATASSQKECIELLSSPSAELLAQEARMKGLVARAKALKAEVLQKLDDTAALGAEIKKLRRDNGTLKATIDGLEGRIQSQLKTRKTPSPVTSLEDLREALGKIFASSGLFGGNPA